MTLEELLKTVHKIKVELGTSGMANPSSYHLRMHPKTWQAFVRQYDVSTPNTSTDATVYGISVVETEELDEGRVILRHDVVVA